MERSVKENGFASALWRTSSYSGQNGACIEVAANVAGGVVVRDSTDREGPVLAFTPAAWRAFTARVRAAAGLALPGGVPAQP
jgi:uncharacterized protein DUF397